MNDCCRHLPPGPEQKQPERCHSCNQTGKPVPHETAAALIKPEFRDSVNGRASAFCETPTCPVIYYASDGWQVLKTQLRVRVGVKETEDPIPVCYCFNVTERMIREEVARIGRSTASARIRAEVRAGNCRCEVENPSGRCCLGEVVQAEKRATKVFAPVLETTDHVPKLIDRPLRNQKLANAPGSERDHSRQSNFLEA